METFDAIVLGGGVAGLCAAYELSKQGLTPLLVEQRGTCGGLLASADFRGVRVDLGAESFARRATKVRELCGELGLSEVAPSGSSWIFTPTGSGKASRIAHGVLGIPANLEDPALDALTSQERARLELDLTMPAQVGADAKTLDILVATRLGEAALEKLVAPVAGGIHSAPLSQLDVDTVAPGLREGLTRTGSLVKAAASLRGEKPGAPAVLSVEGGMFRLPEALALHLQKTGATVCTHTRAKDLVQTENGFTVTLVQTTSGPHGPQDTAQERTVQAKKVVLATDPAAAFELLSGVADLDEALKGWQIPRGADMSGVTLCVRDSRLNSAPRGSGLLVAAPTPGEEPLTWAKALTHYSAKWEWAGRELAEKIGPDTHILRLSYGRRNEQARSHSTQEAVKDAALLLGFEPEEVLEAKPVHWGQAIIPHTPAHRERVAALAQKVAQVPGLQITGAWVAGTGLAAVVPNALEVKA
ncbi:putative protoporphyrinogen oxidase [Winkia neuii]|uniref:protoporphyrinogen/coproporphyrinogen oxidase n=1 Tax=Winkia neuii TaxID=33007 RepID=UPI0007644122|nr:FAD-dependent oxidoreductase [Winkia neuii]KWZ74182.1 putative protoporphyrinogen oxidase [Winkia neuii]